MEYLHVLSRPKVIDQEHDVVWTEAYIDSTVSLHDKAFNLGLLHMMRNWEKTVVVETLVVHLISVAGLC